jgi:predicted DNA-binding transcriptional regulator AlpA
LEFLDISDSKFCDLMNKKEIPKGIPLGGTLHWEWAWLEDYAERAKKMNNHVKRIPPKSR